MSIRLLLVEDDRELSELLGMVLDGQYQLARAPDGAIALTTAADFRPDMIILDMMLPGLHGLDVCRALRQVTSAPVLVLSGLCDCRTKVLALEAGADDYMTKPFELEELRARLKALWRRSAGEVLNRDYYSDGTLTVDLRCERVLLRGRDVDLTPTEYRLLECLVRRRGEVVPTDELLRKVWGEGYREALSCLHIYVHYLRHKVEPEPRAPRYVLARKGKGYTFRTHIGRPVRPMARSA